MAAPGQGTKARGRATGGTMIDGLITAARDHLIEPAAAIAVSAADGLIRPERTRHPARPSALK